MRSRIALAGTVAAFVFSPVAAPAHAGIAPSEALTILNQWRAQTGIPAVQGMDADKNDGCAKHNHYMALNGLGHDEENGKPGYTAAGDAAGNQSVLAMPEGTPRVWEDSVYHRIGVLQPRLVRSGFWASEGFTCMWTLDEVRLTGVPSVKAYPWPPNGGTGVSTRFTSNESPNPYDVTPGVQQLGYLLSVNLDGPWFGNTTIVKVASASLATASGTPVQFTVADDQTPNGGPSGSPIGPYLGDAFGMFPHGELKPATTYNAHAQGTVTRQGTDYPFNLTWHFKTGSPGLTVLRLAKGKVDGDKVKFKLTASPSLVDRAARVTKTTKRPGQTKKVKTSTLRLKAAQTLSAKRPPKGGSVQFRVTTAPFVFNGVSKQAQSAKRKYKR